jgi:hypothetical protein
MIQLIQQGIPYLLHWENVLNWFWPGNKFKAGLGIKPKPHSSAIVSFTTLSETPAFFFWFPDNQRF